MYSYDNNEFKIKIKQNYGFHKNNPNFPLIICRHAPEEAFQQNKFLLEECWPKTTN